MHHILYDCDNTFGLPRKEIDDGLTLLYLLGRSDVELLGVTTTFGNGTAEEARQQTQALLAAVETDGVPVVRGAEERGDPAPEAARFLLDTVVDRKGEVTLLATGPLGNVRAAAELNPDFFANVRQIVCMGGYERPLRVGWRKISELNFSSDPEAAHAVLNAPCPVTVMNAHVCLQARFGLPDLWRTRFWNQAIQRVIRSWLVLFGLYVGVPAFYLWDLLPAIYISVPDLFDRRIVRSCSTIPDLTEGSLVVEETPDGLEREGWINMPRDILNVPAFKQLLFEAWAEVANRQGSFFIASIL